MVKYGLDIIHCPLRILSQIFLHPAVKYTIHTLS